MSARCYDFDLDRSRSFLVTLIQILLAAGCTAVHPCFICRWCSTEQLGSVISLDSWRLCTVPHEEAGLDSARLQWDPCLCSPFASIGRGRVRYASAATWPCLASAHEDNPWGSHACHSCHHRCVLCGWNRSRKKSYWGNIYCGSMWQISFSRKITVSLHGHLPKPLSWAPSY